MKNTTSVSALIVFNSCAYYKLEKDETLLLAMDFITVDGPKKSRSYPTSSVNYIEYTKK